MATTNKVAIEVTLDSTGAVTGIKNIDAASQAWQRSIDAEIEALERAGGKRVDLSKHTGDLGKIVVDTTGHIVNAKLAVDVLGTSEADLTSKLLASSGVFASTKGLINDAEKAQKFLNERWVEAGSSLGGLNSGLLGANVGMAGMVAVAVGAGLAVKSLIANWADYIDEMGELADAEARVNERTRHQLEQEKNLATHLGLTTAQMRARGITLENITRLAKEDKTGEMTTALEAYQYATTGAAREEAARVAVLRQLQDAQDAARKTTVTATEALIAQAGYMNQAQFDEKLDEMTDAYLHVKNATGDAGLAAQMFGADILALTEKGKQFGRVMPEWLAEITDGLKANQRQTELLAAVEEDYQARLALQKAHHAANKAAHTDWAATAVANLKRVIEGSEAYRNEILAIKAAVSSYDTGTDERVQVDKSDPETAAALKRIKDVGGPSSRGALEAAQSGDVGQLKTILAALMSEREMMTGPSGVTGGKYTGGLEAMEYIGKLNTLMMGVEEALRALSGAKGKTPEVIATENMATETVKQTRAIDVLAAEIRGMNARPVVITPDAVNKIAADVNRLNAKDLVKPGLH